MQNSISRTSAYHAPFPSDTSDGTLSAARRRNHRPEGLHLQRERQRALVLMDTPLIPGQNVRVINEMTSESAECFVTSLREKRKGDSWE